MNRLWCFVLFLFFLVVGVTSAAEAKGEESILQNMPYLTIELDIFGTRFYDVRLNGVVLYHSHNHGLPEKREIPVNQWMLSGENNLEVTLVYLDDDPDGEKVDASAILQVRQHGQQTDASIPIATLSFKGKRKTAVSSPAGRFDSHQVFASSKEGDVAVSAVSAQYIPASFETVPAVIIGRMVNLPLKLPKWAFAHSDYVLDKELDDMDRKEANEAYDSLVKDIYPVYKRIHDALRTNKIDEILPLFEERNREIESALYLSPGEARKNLEEFFKKSVDDPNRELVEMIKPEHAYLDVFPNRRMVRMARDGFNAPIIGFTRSDFTMGVQFDIVLRKSGNKWIITR